MKIKKIEKLSYISIYNDKFKIINTERPELYVLPSATFKLKLWEGCKEDYMYFLYYMRGK